MKKKIGIVGYKNSDGVSFGVGNNYLEHLSEFGNPVILMPWQTVDDVDIDMLFLPGGLDTSPANYGEVPGFKTTNQDVFKEYFFRERLKGYIDANMPIFATCLGAQMIAVYFDSKLKQNLKYHAQSKDRWETAHEVQLSNVIDGEIFYKGGKKIKVNSHHHQAVLNSGLNHAQFSVLAFAENEENKADPIIEAAIHKTLPIVLCQWHSEELYDDYSTALINWLLKD